MTAALIAQLGGAAWNIGQIVIVVIVIAAVIGIGMVAVRASGIAIPDWVYTIFWIVVIAFVAIVAIKFLLGAV